MNKEFMTFDINQTEFPSNKHKEIWYWAVQILPEELCLSDKVKVCLDSMDAELFEGCRQMRLFLLHSLGEMYVNAEKYNFTPHGYLIYCLFFVNKMPQCDYVIKDEKWKMNHTEYEKIFSKAGMEVALKTDSNLLTKNEYVITNTLYPKMFRAMHEMFLYSRKRKEHSQESSFIKCDFRKICPGYKYAKGEARIYMRGLTDRIPLCLNGEMREAAYDFAAFISANKLPLKPAYGLSGWSSTGLSYNSSSPIYIRLHDMDFLSPACKDAEDPKIGNKWIAGIHLVNIEKYTDTIIAEGLQDFVWNNFYPCASLRGGDCNKKCYPGYTRTVLGKEITQLCRHFAHKTIPFTYVYDPDMAAMKKIKKLLELEIMTNQE